MIPAIRKAVGDGIRLRGDGNSCYTPPKDGKVKIPDGPGWGVKINPAWIEKAACLKTERPTKS